MALTISVNGTALPSAVEVERGDEMLWSEGTGRGATDGLLVGSVVAKKQTFKVRWGVLTSAEYEQVRAIPQGFFALLVKDGSTTLASMTAYRSNVTGTVLGTYAGTTYWKDAEVQFTQR